MKKLVLLPLIILVLILVQCYGFNNPVRADEETVEIPQFDFPVFITSAGQDPQFEVLGVFANLAGLKFDLFSMPTVSMLEKGVGLGGVSGVQVKTDLSIYPLGTQYKTVFITMGASMKGMGAAGISADDENRRVENIVKWIKDQEEIIIIGVHVAGEDRRYHHLSEGMIDRVAPFSDLLIISYESDEDGRFTDISNQFGIPMLLIETEFELIEIIQQYFQSP